MADGFLDGRAGLAGRRAVVVGGGAIVGRAVTLGLAGAGVDIVFCDIDEEGLHATTEDARKLGVKVASMRADATVSAELASFYDLVEREFDGVDILVNVVGGVKRKTFLESTPESWQDDIHRNFGYALESIHRVLPLMQKRGRGSIVNFTTIEAHRGAATFSVYAGAKAALTNFTRAVAVELGLLNIRVNTIAPDSPAPEHFSKMMETLPPEMAAAERAMTAEQQNGNRRMYIPMGRAASLDDIANGVLFLASDLAASVTGTTLHVDGGTNASSGFINWPYGVGFLPSPRGKALTALFPSS